MSSAGVSEALDSPDTFRTKITIGWIGLSTCAYFIVFILKRIELNKTIPKHGTSKFDKSIGNDTAFKVTISSPDNDDASVNTASSMLDTPDNGDDLALNHRASSFEQNVHDITSNPHAFDKAAKHNEYINVDENGNQQFMKSKLRMDEKLTLYGLVSFLLFLTYLLLVYLPAGAGASLFAIVGSFCIMFKSQVGDEIRRKRLDRLCAIMTLIIYASAFLSLLTYGHIGKAEGIIYEGPARIVGYDTDVYETTSGSGSNVQTVDATRMDLKVAWGAEWGCPDYADGLCTADVAGALCEADTKEAANRVLKNKNNGKNKNTDTSKNTSKNTSAASATTTNSATTSTKNTDTSSATTSSSKSAGTSNATTTASKSTGTSSAATSQTATTTATTTATETAAEEQLEEEIAELKQENQDLTEKNSQLESEVKEEGDEINEEVVVANEYENIAVSEENQADKYYEIAKEEAEEVVIEGGEVVEMEVAAEYYANNAEKEAEQIIMNEGEEGEEELINIENESINDYNNEIDVAEEAIDVGIEEIEEIAYYDPEDLGEAAEELVEDTEEVVTEAVIEDIEKNYYEDLTNGDNNSQSAMNDDTFTQAEEEEALIAEEEMEEEVSSYYNSQYAFDDDNFQDDWWSSSWTDVWGEYACNDLFDSDLEDQTYDVNEPPGNDDWPFVNIYGSCTRCEAYLVDYYSTEHFNTIKAYQTHAKIYAGWGSFGLVLTIGLVIKQWLHPADSNQMGLLMNEGGNMV